MEKPRKKELTVHGHENCPECNRVGWNACHDAMSTWLEGEVPSEEDILEIINNPPMEKTTKYAESEAWMCDGEVKLAKAIHVLLTRKLTGKV